MGLFRKPLPATRREPSHAPDHDQRPAWMQNGIKVALLDGHDDLNVVGESFHQDNLWHLVGGRRNPEIHVRSAEMAAVLVAEYGNEHDPNAVGIWIDGLKVGHLSRDDAARYRPGLLALQQQYRMAIALPAVIVGGGNRDNGPGMLGVFMRHDADDFGLSRPHRSPPPGSAMRTGLSDALASDDSSHLAWMTGLPADSMRAIPALRNLLRQEQNPLARHFMHAHLQTLLYRSRDTFASALDEYDKECRDHDAEMINIRVALIAKWGGVPFLEIYRQMAIRQQKAGDFRQALWWVERGIAIYGDDAVRPEAVTDLRKRAETYRARLDARPATE